LVDASLKEGYNVVATSRGVSQSLTASPSLVLVDSDIGKQETAAKAVEAAIKRQFLCQEILGQVYAPDHQGRRRTQSASRSPQGFAEAVVEVDGYFK
jgi:hypothetical protein